MSEDAKSTDNSFDTIKEVAFQNIGSMLRDLQAFEDAIKEENIPEIYRIYQGKLHEELKKTSNKNHEIDQLLAQKIHDRFTEKFPFMHETQEISPTMHYYKMGDYYRERPTIAIDADKPEIFVLPQIQQEWDNYHPENRDTLDKIEKEIDHLDANIITAQSELEQIDAQLKEIEDEKAAKGNNKSLFGRGKDEEEIESLSQKEQSLQEERQKWLPYVGNLEKTHQKREELIRSHRDYRLRQAVVTKEFRLIDRYFGSMEKMQTSIEEFLADYLGKSEGGDQA